MAATKIDGFVDRIPETRRRRSLLVALLSRSPHHLPSTPVDLIHAPFPQRPPNGIFLRPMAFLEVSLPSNRFWSNSEAKFRQNWDFANRMRSVVSVVSTDNFVTAARQGRLSLLRLRLLCQSKVFLAIFRYFGLF